MLGNKVEEKIPPSDTHFSDYLQKDHNHRFLIRPVDDEEVESMISQLNISKSCGPNSIPTKLLKDNLALFLSPLKYIINLSFHEGCFPDMLTVVDVCPIFKKKCKKKV